MLYTALSRKVVGKKCKSARDNPERCCGYFQGILRKWLVTPWTCLRVLRDTNKSRFDSYSVRNVPCFETVFQLKKHFLENCQAEISPATDTTFQIGYYAEGSIGNKKFSISSEIQLAEAFSLVKNGKITLWVDPHKDVPRSSLGRMRKGKENNNPCYLHILLLVRFSTDV